LRGSWLPTTRWAPTAKVLAPAAARAGLVSKATYDALASQIALRGVFAPQRAEAEDLIERAGLYARLFFWPQAMAWLGKQAPQRRSALERRLGLPRPLLTKRKPVLVVTRDKMESALPLPIPATRARQRKVKSEAHFLLARLSQGAQQFYYADQYANGALRPKAFPPSVAWTPARRCCKAPGGRCQPVATAWAHPTWRMLSFRPVAAYRFQYRVTSAGTEARATIVLEARVDRDCNGFFEIHRTEGKVGPEGSVLFSPTTITRAGE
jgi:hypothetical protein